MNPGLDFLPVLLALVLGTGVVLYVVMDGHTLGIVTVARAVLDDVKADGSGVLIRAALTRPYRAIWRVPFDGSAPQMVIGDENSDIGGLIRDPYSDEVVAAWSSGIDPQTIWLDDKARLRAAALKKAFGGKDAELQLVRGTRLDLAALAGALLGIPRLDVALDLDGGRADGCCCSYFI